MATQLKAMAEMTSNLQSNFLRAFMQVRYETKKKIKNKKKRQMHNNELK